MSTSELRRGPGWWMDLNGQWNPPESWPESSPPLPGWTRDASGKWSEPASTDALADHGGPELVTPATRPVPESAPTIPPLPNIAQAVAPEFEWAELPTEPMLGFADAQAEPRPDDAADRSRKRATNAAILAAVTAVMIAAGVVVLLALL